jgi:hypothetical protein
MSHQDTNGICNICGKDYGKGHICQFPSDAPSPSPSPLVIAADQLAQRLNTLATTLDAIENSPSYKAAWEIAFLHGHKYIGPNWKDDLTEARTALANYKRVREG